MLLLTATFFLVIAAYTLTKELKDSVFVSIVGREWLPRVKLISMIMLVPAILLYSRLVDMIRRYQLLYIYSLFYGLANLFFAYYIGHPTIGIANTDSGPHRLFGWVFYFVVEGYSPFIVSVFWAFVNSICSSESAKKYYGLMVSGSKLGGALAAALGWALLSLSQSSNNFVFSDITTHRVLLLIAACCLLVVPFVIGRLIARVPGRFLHGEEAVYKFEKQRRREERVEERVHPKGFVARTREAAFGMVSGLYMLVRQPYLLGIFGIVFFYEIINAVFNYQRLGVSQAETSGVVGLSVVLFQQRFAVHFLGFIISLVGTKVLLSRFGERVCLLLVPLVTGGLLLYLLSSYDSLTSTYGFHAIFIVFILLQAMHYAFSYPIREVLYIPTVKEIKFKSKSWIDAFGSKLAKTSGQACNAFVDMLGPALLFPAHMGLFIGIIGMWSVTAFFVGKRFRRAIDKQEAIGFEN